MKNESLWRGALLAIFTVTAGASLPDVHADPLPGQPFASYWYPSTLLTWDPTLDPDAPYNRSGVPLAPRFANPDLAVNPHARPDEARVAALVAFAPTSFNPSQGSPVMSYYALNYWQYIDQLVFWGGSAGEGLILAPNPTVIDAAHRNGVPVLGNVFFPPNVYGGDIQFVRDFVQRDGASFPVADKLIEAATYYGFDGWFINQETSGGDATLAADMRDMMEYLKTHSNLRIVWYDAMIANGAISYQNALDAQNQMFFEDGNNVVSDAMFLNFNWSANGLQSSAALATSLGRSPYELYAGADVEAHGYNTGVNWNGVFPEGQPHRTSIGFYRPEWTYNSSSSTSDFYTRDNHFWVGPNHDPSNTTTSAAWKGIANYIPATTPISALPFVTNFNTGQGSRYAIDGVTLATSEWNNLGLQDILPTWRWIVRGTGSLLAPDLDWSDAYWGGTSLEISGTLDAVNDLPLYETHLDVDTNTTLAIAYKAETAGPTHLEVGLAFEDAPSAFEYFDVGDASDTDWNTKTFDLGAFAGRTIAIVALRVVPDANSEPYAIRVGRLAVYESPLVTPAPPTHVAVISKNDIDADTATLRLQWVRSTDPVNSYAVLQHHADGSQSWLGGTANNAYFVADLTRDGNEATTTIDVEAVSPSFVRSAPASTIVTWNSIFVDGFDGGPSSPRH
ncbi:MAG: hypothetical protein WB784_00835 [Rhodanobacteraceae bacterium]